MSRRILRLFLTLSSTAMLAALAPVASASAAPSTAPVNLPGAATTDLPPAATAGAEGHRGTAAVRPAAVYGPFNIRAQNSNKCLDIAGGPGATGDGVVTQIWDCYGPTQTNQQWYFRDTGDPFVYNVIARHSGKCLDVPGGPGAVDRGLRLQQFGCLGYFQTNQKWLLSTTGTVNGIVIYKLTAMNSGKCVDVAGGPGVIGNGAWVQQWDCLGDEFTSQRWYLTIP
jgi:hypothetical protein